MTRQVAAEPAASPAGANLPILLVEDEPVNQRVIARILKKHGYRVEFANDGQQALERLRDASFALIIMDCEMPILNGYGAARAIRKSERGGRRIPILAVTAHTIEDVRDEVLAAGMDDCVSKLEVTTRLPQQLARWCPGAQPASDTQSEKPPRGSSARPTPAPIFGRSAATVRVFLKHVGGQWAAIEAAAHANDFEALRRAAHKLRGTCLAVGIPRLATLCAELELTPGRPGALLVELERELRHVRAQLEAAGFAPA